LGSIIFLKKEICMSSQEIEPRGILLLAFEEIAFDHRLLMGRTAAQEFLGDLDNVQPLLLALTPVLDRNGKEIVSRREGSPVQGQTLCCETMVVALTDMDPKAALAIVDSLRASGFRVGRGKVAPLGDRQALVAIASTKANQTIETRAAAAPVLRVPCAPGLN
jgi:hypothetical protein